MQQNYIDKFISCVEINNARVYNTRSYDDFEGDIENYNTEELVRLRKLIHQDMLNMPSLTRYGMPSKVEQDVYRKGIEVIKKMDRAIIDRENVEHPLHMKKPKYLEIEAFVYLIVCSNIRFYSNKITEIVNILEDCFRKSESKFDRKKVVETIEDLDNTLYEIQSACQDIEEDISISNCSREYLERKQNLLIDGEYKSFDKNMMLDDILELSQFEYLIQVMTELYKEGKGRQSGYKEELKERS
jgi:hypothetical protein